MNITELDVTPIHTFHDGKILVVGTEEGELLVLRMKYEAIKTDSIKTTILGREPFHRNSFYWNVDPTKPTTVEQEVVRVYPHGILGKVIWVGFSKLKKMWLIMRSGDD